MPEFFRTPMGQRFYQSTMPQLVENLGRIATQLEKKKDSKPKEVFVLVGVYQGVVDDVEVSLSHNRATEIENDLCAKYGVPVDPEEREEYYEKNPEPNEVYRFEVEEIDE